MTEWRVSPGLTDYRAAEAAQERRAAALAADKGEELVWLLEHPPLYTAGASARSEDLLAPDRFPVFETRRGGQFTYHGPGQRVVYLVLDLRRRGRDVRAYVRSLEAWIIDVLTAFGVHGERREDRVGVWVRGGSGASGDARREDAREDKIAAIGVRVRRWIAFHGVSINVDPALDHYAGVRPCGISEHGVTSLAKLGVDASMPALDAALKQRFDAHLGARPSAL